MKPIPLIRARYVCNIIEVLNHQAAPVERYLERANLSVELLENTEGIISAHSLWGFVGDAALDADMHDLGYLAGRTPLSAHGDTGSKVIHAISLHNAIKIFCYEAHAEYSDNNFFLHYGPARSWFCTSYHFGTTFQKQQAELYALMLMIQTTQLFLGVDWKPEKVRLQYTSERDVADNSFLTNLNIEFNAQFTAIEIPSISLATPLQIAKRIEGQAVNLDKIDSASSLLDYDGLSALRLLLGKYLLHHKVPGINLAAEIAGMSTRTFQRQIKQTGNTFSKLLDETRFELAVSMLNEDSITITNIASAVGYSSLAHFSRSFHRITGMSPSSYREMVRAKEK